MRIRPRHAALALIALGLLIAAGCGGAANSDGEQGGESGLVVEVADGWSATVVGEGIKPALALDGAGTPAIAWLKEDFKGYVRFAAGADWEQETVAEGYFYGPIGLAFGPDGAPQVVWHDHQDSVLDPAKGDLARAVGGDGGWEVGPLADPGHDGWDSTIAVAPDGTVHAAAVDPSQFNSDDGVEHYVERNGTWSVTSVGTGPIAYEFNVSLALDNAGRPVLTYYNDREADLELARLDGTEWKIEKVASEGDAGKFSSLALDAEGRQHISFFQQTSDTSGTIRYAFFDGGGWSFEDVGELGDVELGQVGARRNSALALDADGVPHIAFTDRSGLYYAVRSGDGTWQVEDVLAAEALPLGQLVSLAFGPDGAPHLATYDVTDEQPLDGNVYYITAT